MKSDESKLKRESLVPDVAHTHMVIYTHITAYKESSVKRYIFSLEPLTRSPQKKRKKQALYTIVSLSLWRRRIDKKTDSTTAGAGCQNF